jgi:hypothetical protein
VFLSSSAKEFVPPSEDVVWVESFSASEDLERVESDVGDDWRAFCRAVVDPLPKRDPVVLLLRAAINSDTSLLLD